MLPYKIKFRLPTTLVQVLPLIHHTSAKNHLRQYTASVTTEIADLVSIIGKEDRIQSEEKPLFRSYWNSFSPDQRNGSKTILQRVPLPDIVRFIQSNKKSSSTVRGLYRRELIYNFDTNKEKVYKLIEELNLSSRPIKSKEDILALCIEDSLSTNDATIAADIYTQYYTLNNHEPLNSDLCRKIISALAFEHPKYDHLHLMKYLELDKLYDSRGEKVPLTQIQIVTLCNKAYALENSPIVTKQTLNRLMDIELTPIKGFRNDKMTAAYHLIEKDYSINNAAGVFLTWTTIKNHYISVERHDARILYKIIKMFTRHKAYRVPCKELISQLPPEYYANSPLLLPTLIDYATKVADLALAKELMANVNKHLTSRNTQIVLFSRRCLSSFLRMHLRFKDSKGVDRVLNQIQESFGRHSEENLSAIVGHLVEVKSFENLTKAIQLVEKIPRKKSLMAIGSIVNKIVEWQIASDERFDATSMPILDNLLHKAHEQDPYHKNTLWDVVASLFIKKTVHYRTFQRPNNRVVDGGKSKRLDTTGLNLAKLIYIRSTDERYLSSNIDVNPFAKTSPQHVILKISNRNKLVILRNIALSAIKGRRKDIFLWCCSKLYQSGMPTKELILDWNMMLNHEIRRAKFAQRIQIEKDLSLQGWSFLEKTLH